MSLDKAIQYGKEHRRQYKRAELFSRSCRNHGTCSWCKNNRTHKFKRASLSSKQQIKEYNIMEEATVTISKEEYESLKDHRAWRLAFESAGVDNWEGYDYAMEIYSEFDNE
jgi:hypothetical protein